MGEHAPARYVFSDANIEREARRLHDIEVLFDPASRHFLRQTGVTAGWSCLEVGAGAGSVARWLSNVVGPTGRVVALDLNTRFAIPDDLARVDFRDQDIRTYDSEERFDLIHARYLLIHIPDFDRALARMVAHLQPGGWLVLEEPDFSAARGASGPPALVASFDRVNQAIERMFVSRGMDHAFGLHLPKHIGDAGLCVVAVENDVPLVPGRSGVAAMMKKSAEQLRDKYIATGAATSEDVENYCQLSEAPSAWAIYYATVRACARRPAYP
jgi:SAM-dependent methyltransferase